MSEQHCPSETKMAEAYESRAAALRRAAADLRSPEDRAELEAIAAGYEADAARLRESTPISRAFKSGGIN
jgi:hypothetical protein